MTKGCDRLVRLTVSEVIESYLREHGYDGLYSPTAGCACVIGDLFPLDCPRPDCTPGYRVPCTNPCSVDTCDAPGEYEFHIVDEKPITQGG